MSYDQSTTHRDGSYTSGNTDVQSRSHGARADDNTISHSDNSHSGGARMINSDPSSHTSDGSSMNTGPVRYDNYVPGGDNDSSSRDITSSRNSDYEYEQEQGAGRGAEAQNDDAVRNNTGNDDFGAGDIGQPISNGYDSGSAGWARENSVSDDSLGASRSPGYASDSAPDTSAVSDPTAFRGDTYDTGSADRNLGSEGIASSGVQSTSDDTGNSKNAGSYDESRSALASTFEEASTSNTGTKGEESTGSTGDHGPSIGASTTSDAPDADNGAYQGGSTRARRDDIKGGTDTDNYGRSPYDSTNGGRDTPNTSSDGQTLPSQRGSSTLDDDQQVQDATIRSSKADAGASTSGDRPSVSEGKTSSKDLQQSRDMTSDTSGSRSDNPSTNTKYGGPPYNTTGLGRDSRTTSSDSQPLSTVQRGSSAPCDNQQGRDAAAAKTPRKDSNIRSVSDDTADHRSYDRGANTSETTTGYTGNKSTEDTGPIGDSNLGTNVSATSGSINDESEGWKDAGARTEEPDTSSSTYDASDVRGDSQTDTSDGKTSSSQQTSYALYDDERGRDVPTSEPKADVDNNDSSPFDDRPSSRKDEPSGRETSSDTSGRDSGSRNDDAPTQDVDNTGIPTSDNQSKNNQGGRDASSNTTERDLGSKRDDTSSTSHMPASGAVQPPDTIRYGSGREDNEPSGDNRTGAGSGDSDYSGYGGYAASTGHQPGVKLGLKDKLRGNAEVLVGKAAKKPELVERGLERKAGNVV